MSDDHEYQEFLDVFRLGASESTLKSNLGVPPRDDRLSPGPSSNDGPDDNKHPDLEPHAVQASRSKPNFDDKGQRPVLEPSMSQVSTPVTPTDRETEHRKQCGNLYLWFLSQRADTKATVPSAGDLCEMLMRLGMSPEVTKNELLESLKTSRYADESGLMDFECFSLFAKDYKLLESLLAHSASQHKGGKYSEEGPLRGLFDDVASSHRDAKHREECDDCFKLLLKQRGDPTATVLRADELCEMLKKLGMRPTKVKENELQSILNSLSEYADGNGTMDFERFMKFAGDFKLLELLRDFKASQRKGGEYVERGPLVDHVESFDFGGLEPGIPGSRSNDGGMRKEPIYELPSLSLLISTSATPNYRAIMHRRDCQSCCIRLLSDRGNANTTAFLAGALCEMLKELGMAPEVTDDELSDTLKLSGYTDEDGTLDFEQFVIFAKDFVLLESLHVHKASQLHVQGPLEDFFDILKSGEDQGYSSVHFSNAFNRLSINLTDEAANILAGYANSDPGLSITFEEFVRQREEHLQRTGLTMSLHRNVALDKGHCLGRLMAFVSSYTRSDRALGKLVAMQIRNKETVQLKGDVR